MSTSEERPGYWNIYRNMVRKSLLKISQAWYDRDCISYLFLTCKETYLALKFSIMALLAWSISFWASPRRLWERLTACINTQQCIYLYTCRQDERQHHKWGQRTANVFRLKIYQWCNVSMRHVVRILLPVKFKICNLHKIILILFN